MQSCTFFSLFVSKLASEMINNGRHRVTFISFFVELFILLFADDIILLSETVVGLQTQLNSWRHVASELKFQINTNKSSIIVSRIVAIWHLMRGGFMII